LNLEVQDLNGPYVQRYWPYLDAKRGNLFHEGLYVLRPVYPPHVAHNFQNQGPAIPWSLQ